jgi:isopentenyl-diphosphate delta-isomerase
VGVTIIDVAGAGGTSWAGVEILRRNSSRNGKGRDFASSFWDWGISTVDALRQVSALKQQHSSLKVIASGGIASGLDVAKAIALGADLAGAARPMLKALEKGGKRGLLNELDTWSMELRGAMFLTGSRTIVELGKQQLVLV